MAIELPQTGPGSEVPEGLSTAGEIPRDPVAVPPGPPDRAAIAPREAARRGKARYWGSPAMDDGPIDFWLMSYADMVTLLMTVFIILVLMAGMKSSGNPGRPGVDEGVNGARGFLNNIFELRAMSPYADENGYVMVGREGATGALTPEQRKSLAVIKAEDLERIRWRQATLDDITIKLGAAHLESYVKAEFEGGNIRINVPDPVTFVAGIEEVDPRGLAVLRALVPVLSVGDFSIVVEGHTDDTPPAPGYKSNWEFSAARAAFIVRLLIEGGIAAKRLEVAGFADTHPIMNNRTPEGRAQNRRVTILLTPPR